MNAPAFPASTVVIPAEFQSCFDAQRAAYLKAPEPTHAERLADLKGLARLVKENRAAIVAAINGDYGSRSEFETTFAEIFPCSTASTTRQSASKGWMRPRRRRVDRHGFRRRGNRLDPAAARRRRRDRAVELIRLC